MAAKITNTSPFRFRGSPVAMESLVPIAPHEATKGILAVDLEIRWKETYRPPLALHPIPAGTSATRLRLVLPESTPPGTYKGKVQIGDSEYPILADVEPYPHLLLSPDRLWLQAAAGSETEVDLTLVNAGNVTCDVGKAYAFGLFDEDGLDRGIAAAFQEDAAQGRGRIDRLADELAEGHGGIVRVLIQEGAGPVAPGELRNLRLKLRFPDRLKPGHNYFGTWSLYNLVYSVEVQATGQKEPRRSDERQ